MQELSRTVLKQSILYVLPYLVNVNIFVHNNNHVTKQGDHLRGNVGKKKTTTKKKTQHFFVQCAQPPKRKWGNATSTKELQQKAAAHRVVLEPRRQIAFPCFVPDLTHEIPEPAIVLLWKTQKAQGVGRNYMVHFLAYFF